MARLYAADDAYHALVCKIRVFSALKHKGSEAQIIAHVAAFKDFIFGQPVALGVFVAASYAAIFAVVFADVGKFN